MGDEGQRIHAIQRFLQGEAVTAICRAMGRSRRWFYKWLRRYDPGDPQWAHSQSRAPKQQGRRTSATVAEMVCAIRTRLQATRYAQRGAMAIQWHLAQLGIQPVPPP